MSRSFNRQSLIHLVLVSFIPLAALAHGLLGQPSPPVDRLHPTSANAVEELLVEHEEVFFGIPLLRQSSPQTINIAEWYVFLAPHRTIQEAFGRLRAASEDK